MIVECLAIIVIVAAMSVIFMRANKPNYAVSTIALTIVPVFHLAGSFLSKHLVGLFTLTETELYLTFDLLGLVLACVALSLLSTSIKSKKSRTVFLIATILFSLILTCIFIVNILRV